MRYLEGLNDAQQKAVLHQEGPLLIVAGAGAGKTKVLVHRMLNLIKEGVAPESILAVTFTNKAAKEMRERVAVLLRSDPELNRPLSRAALRSPSPFISTFHSLGVHIIKENAGLLGLERRFSIYDRADSMRAVKEAMKREGVDPKQHEPRKILGIISREKGAGRTAEEYAADAASYTGQIVASIWPIYENILAENKALDFDDLLLKAAQVLESHPDVRERYHRTWQYLLVDEYQDTNEIQFRMSELLAGPSRNICVVGDIDQNIYSWRGATIENLMDFEKVYPGTTVVLLEENYRSTKTILDAANAVIERNKNRIEKKLFTENGEGDLITLHGGFDEGAEAHFTVEKAAELHRSGVPFREIAVLYRTNFQSRVLEEAFLYAGVPYQVLGTRFFERKEVKDVLSFLRAAQNPASSADISRIIDVPPRGIGKVTLLRMVTKREHELSPALRKRADDFWNLLQRIRECAETKPPSETIKFIVTTTGIEKALSDGTEDDQERLLNAKELVTLATKYDGFAPQEGVEKLLEDAALASDQDELIKDQDAVKLMTIHASKGLEFDCVFVTGLEEGLFPQRTDLSAQVGEDARDQEEERRLFYVALTRARAKLFLTFASTRVLFGSREVQIPSEFISDIPEHLLQEDDYERADTGLLIID